MSEFYRGPGFSQRKFYRGPGFSPRKPRHFSGGGGSARRLPSSTHGKSREPYLSCPMVAQSLPCVASRRAQSRARGPRRGPAGTRKGPKYPDTSQVAVRTPRKLLQGIRMMLDGSDTGPSRAGRVDPDRQRSRRASARAECVTSPALVRIVPTSRGRRPSLTREGMMAGVGGSGASRRHRHHPRPRGNKDRQTP